MKTILLIDDDQEILDCLGETLRRLNYSVIAMRDGSSALELMHEGRTVDLVITDYLMPGMDGLQFMRYLRQVLPDLPVILLTEYCTLESYCLASSLGVAKYVAKPVRAKELGRVVADVFAQSGAPSLSGKDVVPFATTGLSKMRADEHDESNAA